MKKTFRIIIILIISVISYISLEFYLYCKKTYIYSSLEIVFSRFLVLIFFNFLFFSIIFLLNIEHYKKIFKYVLVFVASIWIFYIFGYISNIPKYLWNLWEILTLLSFSMIAPGLNVYIIYYIKKFTAKFESTTILGKYHLHEGFIGIIFIIIGFVLLILRSFFLFLSSPYYRRLSYILLLTQIFSFIFLYIGSFFFFRDRHDIFRLKFIEVISESHYGVKEKESSVFSITKEDLHFFIVPNLFLYPFGMLLTIFSLNMIIYGTDFLPNQIFNLNDEAVVHLGYFFCFIAGGIIGIDWFRIFRKFYPISYQEIENIIRTLRNNNNN